MLGEVEMVGRNRWEKSIVGRVRARRFGRLLARLDLDRKTVRRCLRQTEWPYERAARSETLLTAHAEYLRRRASTVDYSARSCSRSSGGGSTAAATRR